MYCLGVTLVYTILAELALLVVDISEIGGDCDALRGAGLGTLATADTSHLALLHGDSAFLLVGAGHIYTHTARALIAQLDDGAGAGLHTGAATDTLVLDDVGQAGLAVHLHSSVGTSLDTVATAETAVGTSALAGAERSEHGTGGSALEAGMCGTEVTGAVTLEDSDFGFGDSRSEADDVADLLHYLGARRGTREAVEGGCAYTGHGKVAATAASASAAVGTGQKRLDLIDARVLVDMELLSHEIKHCGSHDSYESEDDDG